MMALHMVFISAVTLLVASSSFQESSASESYSSESSKQNSTLGDITEEFGKRIADSSRTESEEDVHERIPEPSALLTDSSNYRMPGLFGFNGGEPFYLEKDPVTGAVNFTVKTSNMQNDGDDPPTESSLKNHKISETENSEEYYYDDEEVEDDIDRRDGSFEVSDSDAESRYNSHKSYPPTINEVNTNLNQHNGHKQQSNYNKFPLISSSYANTKIQGTASGNKNHRPYVTTSTQSPSYYTIRPQPTFLTSTPFRGTVKYASTTTQKNELPKKTYYSTTEATTYYKSTTAAGDYVKYNPQKINSHSNNQPQATGYDQLTKNKHQQPQDYDGYDDKEEQISEELLVQGEPTSLESGSKDSSFQTSNKPTESSVDYEEESNEDYDDGFSLSALFGYGKPSKTTKKPPSEEKNQQEQEQQHHHQQSQNQQTVLQQGNNQQHSQNNQQSKDRVQDEERPTVVTTVYSVYPSSTTTKWSTSVQQGFTSEEENLIPDKNQKASQVHTTIETTTLKTTRIPSTTVTPGVVYSEPNTLKTHPTSLPINTQSNFKPYITQQVDANYSPSLSVNPNIHVQSSTQTNIEDSVPGPSEHVNTVIKPNVNHQHTGTKPLHFNGGQFGISTVKDSPYGSFAEEPFRPIFGPGELDDKPLLRRPEHQPLVAPPANDKNSNTIISTGTASVNIVSKPPNVKIPQETPTRWNYPYNEGTSSFFQLPPREQYNQNPPANSRHPGLELSIPRPPSTPPFIKLPNTVSSSFNIPQQQQKPAYNSETSITVGSSLPNFSKLPEHINEKQNPSQVSPVRFNNDVQKKGDTGHVVFPDSRPEGARPHTDALKRPITPSVIPPIKESIANGENQQLPIIQEELGQYDRRPPPLNQRRPTIPPPVAPQQINQNIPPGIQAEPAQDLQPPAEPENLRKHSVPGAHPRPPWESRPPFSQLPPSQTARPKHDTVSPPFVQNNGNNGHRIHSNFPPEVPFPGNRPHQISKNRNQNSNLPNILPQFRPNAKISHVHVENGGRIQANPYFNNLRQPLLDRPSRRPPPEYRYQSPPPNRRRVNRNDAPVNEEPFPFEKYPPQPPAIIQPRPLVHRRTGPQAEEEDDGSLPQVATLQMMQHQHQGPTPYHSKPLAARDDFPPSADEIKPPFQLKYPSGSALDVEASEKRPVFVVYPVNTNPQKSDSNGVVIGSRGPQRPLPPSNLDSESGLSLSSEDIALPFPNHNKNQKPLLQLPSDRLENQSHKPTLTIKPFKSDFPYPLVKPDPLIDLNDNEEKVSTKEYEEKSSILASHISSDRNDHDVPNRNDKIQVEVHNNQDERPDEDDAEINIIPYLQDYMPFATKKPLPSNKITSEKASTVISPPSGTSVSYINTVKPEKRKPGQWISPADGEYPNQEARIVLSGSPGNKVHSSTSSAPESQYSSSPISVVLKTVQPHSSTTHSPHSSSSTPYRTTDHPKSSPSSSVTRIVSGGSSQQGLVGSGGSEFTLSAVMHTHSQAMNNHRPAEGATSTALPQLNFQAPFLASANIGATPVNQGWSVVGNNGSSNERMKPGAVEKADIHDGETDSSIKGNDQSGEPNNFDFENFKPQLFGGFKPIYSFPEESAGGPSKHMQTTERQEKAL